MSVPNDTFQSFQRAFAAHLRDPHRVSRPAGVPPRRAAVYQELVFNNFGSFLDSCFPICRQLLGEKRWRTLLRACFRDWPCATPWFREIPREFLDYLASPQCRQRLPRWFYALAHYEWAELAVDIMDTEHPTVSSGDLMQGCPVLNPALMNLAYDWPVHRIGPDCRPRRQQTTCLLVYRDAEDTVRFTVINPVTARLVAMLGERREPGEAVCRRLAEEMAYPDPEALLSYGASLLEDLCAQHIILGVEA